MGPETRAAPRAELEKWANAARARSPERFGALGGGGGNGNGNGL